MLSYLLNRFLQTLQREEIFCIMEVAFHMHWVASSYVSCAESMCPSDQVVVVWRDKIYTQEGLCHELTAFNSSPD
jgi:hypothetical protein